jgi:hypothetical protein
MEGWILIIRKKVMTFFSGHLIFKSHAVHILRHPPHYYSLLRSYRGECIASSQLAATIFSPKRGAAAGSAYNWIHACLQYANVVWF